MDEENRDSQPIEWVTVKSFSTPIEAHVAKTMLESEGIECFVRDEHSIGMRNHLSLALGGVRLDVPKEELETARQLLDTPALPPEPKRCPHCGAEARARPDAARTLTAIFSTLLTMIPMPFFRPSYRCVACGRNWRAK